MPNHITNHIYVECPSERFLQIANELKGKDDFLGTVDFNKLIPMPGSLDIEAGTRGEEGYCAYKEFADKAWELGDDDIKILEAQYRNRFKDDPEIWELGKRYYENRQKYGAPNWYDWCLRHWNTKWNAYECDKIDEKSDCFSFWTAWSCVTPVVEAMSRKYPDVDIHYRWADEDIGSNTGEFHIKNGILYDENYPNDLSREAYELAAELWGINLNDEGLYLSEDGTTYDYKEEN